MRGHDSKPRNEISKRIFEDYKYRYDNGLPIENPEVLLDNLTILQRNFVIEFMKHLDGSKAVVDAGFNTIHPKQISWQLLSHKKIAFVIELLQIKRARKSVVTKDYVLREIQQIVEDCKSVEGNHYEEKQAALRGLELLAKHLGMFIERTEITGKDGEAIKYEKVLEDAGDFTRAVAGLADRAGTTGIPLKVVGGSQSKP